MKKNTAIEKLDSRMVTAHADGDGLVWQHAYEKPFELTGFPWFDKEKIYRRFPENVPAGFPKGVDQLAWHTSGGKVRFVTNSERIVVQVKLRGHMQMYHMPRTGSSGFDLYTGGPGKEKYYYTAADMKDEFQKLLWLNESGKKQTLTIYFPLYQGVVSLKIGIVKGALLETPPPLEDPVHAMIFYAGSVTQGGCSSRSGMSYPNIISRLLNRHIYNFGFSGSAKGETPVAEYLADIPNPSLYLLKYEANAGGLFQPTLPGFIDILRKKHSETPIIILSIFTLTGSYQSEKPGSVFSPAHLATNRRFSKAFVEKRRKAGDRNIYFLNGAKIFGKNFSEGTVDGVHMTDLGALRGAQGLAPELKRFLK